MWLKKIFIVLSFVSLSLFFVSVVQAASTSTASQEKFTPICFKPEFPIPNFLNAARQGTCAAGEFAINHTGDTIPIYINALYEYAAGLAGVIAMFMIVFASWQWIMASGNAGKIDNAKDTIKGALLGLTLLFAGNLLLSNITKNLIDFQSLELKSIKSQYLTGFNLPADSVYIWDEPLCAGPEIMETNCGDYFSPAAHPELKCYPGLKCPVAASCLVSREMADGYAFGSCIKENVEQYGPCLCRGSGAVVSF